MFYANIRLIQRDKQHSKIWERLNKHQRIPKGQSKWKTPRKWQHRVQKYKEKQNKSTTRYVLDTTMRKQTQIP
jgi:hypothetical protein